MFRNLPIGYMVKWTIFTRAMSSTEAFGSADIVLNLEYSLNKSVSDYD